MLSLHIVILSAAKDLLFARDTYKICHLDRSAKRIVKRRLYLSFACATLAFTLTAAALGQAIMVDTTSKPGVTAIVGGKLLTITHGTIENGVLLMEGGKITAAGPASSVKVPKGAAVVDARGMTVYPGLIDSETNLGLTEVASDQVNNDLVETSDEIFPHMHVYDAFHAETEHIPIDRFNGITNAIVAPRGADTMPGQDTFIQFAGRDRDQMILTRDIALAMNFGEAPKRGGRGEGGGGGRYPSTRMGEITQLRQALIDAQEYMKPAPTRQKNLLLKLKPPPRLPLVAAAAALPAASSTSRMRR